MSHSIGHGQMAALREKIRHTAVTLRLFAQCMEAFTEDCMSGTHISQAHRTDLAQVLHMLRACSPLSEEEEENNTEDTSYSAHQRDAVVRSRSRSRSAHRQETSNSEDSEAHGRNHQGRQRERSDHSSAAPLHSKESDLSRSMIVCPVCMSSIADISLSSKKLASTRCGHVFCSECLQQLMTSSRQCPTCRKRILKKDIREIYL